MEDQQKQSVGEYFRGIDPDSGFMTALPSIVGGLGEVINGSQLGYYQTQSVSQGQAHGQARGQNIGKGIGAAAGMALGPVGSAIGGALGGLVGGLFGGGKAKKDAMRIVGQRQVKQGNTVDIYRNLANQQKTIADQESAFFGSL